MTPPERGNVAALRYRLPVSAEMMDPLEQIEAMVAGVTEVDLSEAEVAPPPDLLERTLAALRAARARRHDHHSPATCYVDPVRLAKIRQGIRAITNAPSVFDAAIKELVTDWPAIAVAELVVSYSVHNQGRGGPYDAARRDAVVEAIASLGADAVEGMLQALLVEERQDRVLAAIELSPIVGEDSCISDALVYLIDHASPAVGDFAAAALRHIKETAAPAPLRSVGDPGLLPGGHR